MVERIGIAIVVVVAILVILFAVPRYLSSASEGSWPDVMGRLNDIAEARIAGSRTFDAVSGVLGVVLLGAAIVVFLDPTMLGGLGEHVEFVAFPLATLGFAGLFVATYLNVRRSGLYSAEATLIGMGLIGTVLLILITVLLLQG